MLLHCAESEFTFLCKFFLSKSDMSVGLASGSLVSCVTANLLGISLDLVYGIN